MGRWLTCQLLLAALAGVFMLKSLLNWSTYDNPTINHEVTATDSKSQSQNASFIFVGGVPRSGTTLMRVMLDTHPMVRCGNGESHIVPEILSMRYRWRNDELGARHLNSSGITDEVFDAAVSAFIHEVITRRGPPAERLCNKDALNLMSLKYLSRLFPQAQFVLMARDGRASVHSIISRNVNLTQFDLSNPRQCLQMWNAIMTSMYHQCHLVGPERCMLVHYEQLVIHPKETAQRLLSFLKLPWDESVLHHEQFFGSRVKIVEDEYSFDQVIQPINLGALTKWVGSFPTDVVNDMPKIAPMLRHLGYDPMANPPDYGELDARA